MKFKKKPTSEEDFMKSLNCVLYHLYFFIPNLKDPSERQTYFYYASGQITDVDRKPVLAAFIGANA